MVILEKEFNTVKLTIYSTFHTFLFSDMPKRLDSFLDFSYCQKINCSLGYDFQFQGIFPDTGSKTDTVLPQLEKSVN